MIRLWLARLSTHFSRLLFYVGERADRANVWLTRSQFRSACRKAERTRVRRERVAMLRRVEAAKGRAERDRLAAEDLIAEVTVHTRNTRTGDAKR